ncbi:MAG: TAXI family TRAP transporter solute-binding subunit [Treponema sp.]|nr:TAXI family TRAP transporter solute-binding subunit [Treponema sp.]
MRKICVLVLSAAVLLSFSACRDGDRPLVFSLATASLGGTYYIVGAGLAEVLTGSIPHLTVNAVIAQGSTGNPLMLGRGEVDLAMTNYYSAWNALHGTGIYADIGPIPLAGIAKLQYSILQFLVFADSGIYSIADLRGRRVNIGPAGGGGALLFSELLPFWGLTMADVNISFVSYAEGSEALGDGRLDVNVPHGAPPLGAISSVAAFNDIRILDLEEDILQRVIEQYPYYDIAYIPAGTYRGIDRPVRSIGIQDILVVSQDMDEELVYQITKSIYESLAFLRQVHPSLAEMSFDGFRHSLVPLHPGALRFYQERGIPLE